MKEEITQIKQLTNLIKQIFKNALSNSTYSLQISANNFEENTWKNGNSLDNCSSCFRNKKQDYQYSKNLTS